MPFQIFLAFKINSLRQLKKIPRDSKFEAIKILSILEV